MPPLICPSPNVVDQTFPRSEVELALVEKTLSRITELIQQEKCLLLLTQYLSEFIIGLNETFCWEIMKKYPRAQIIFHVLIQFGLQPHGVCRVDVSTVPLLDNHPLPKGCKSEESTLKWSEELGRLYNLHSQCSTAKRFFIGIACTMAFAGKAKGDYLNPEHRPHFPLVGPDELESLDDGFDWEIPPEIHSQNVSFNDAYTKVRLLGGDVKKADGTSHYQVKFKGQRTWPLDCNIDPVPERFLKELEPITGLRLEVIKFVLLRGELPRKVFRLRTTHVPGLGKDLGKK